MDNTIYSNIIKRIHIEITSSPFSILTEEIYKVLEVSSDGEFTVIGRDNAPNINDVKRNLEYGWSRFKEFEFNNFPIIDEELGYYEFTFVNEDEWVKYTVYLENE